MSRLQIAIVSVLLVAAAIAGGYVKDWWRGNPEPVGQPTVEEAGRPMEVGDLLEATMPSKITRYEAPDSSETYQECITLPSWMGPSEAPPTQDPGKIEARKPDSGSSEAKTQKGSGSSVGPSYATIPTTNGRPNVSVGSQQVRLSTFHPWTGAGTTYTYPVPTWDWRLTAQGSAVASRSYALGTTSLMLERNLDVGRIGVGPSYGAVVTQGGYEAGVGLTVSFETTLWDDAN